MTSNMNEFQLKIGPITQTIRGGNALSIDELNYMGNLINIRYDDRRKLLGKQRNKRDYLFCESVMDMLDEHKKFTFFNQYIDKLRNVCHRKAGLELLLNRFLPKNDSFVQMLESVGFYDVNEKFTQQDLAEANIMFNESTLMYQSLHDLRMYGRENVASYNH